MLLKISGSFTYNTVIPKLIGHEHGVLTSSRCFLGTPPHSYLSRRSDHSPTQQEGLHRQTVIAAQIRTARFAIPADHKKTTYTKWVCGDNIKIIG